MRFQDMLSPARVAQDSTPPPVTLPCCPASQPNRLFVANLSHTIHLKSDVACQPPWRYYPLHKPPDRAMDVLSSVTFNAAGSELLAVVGPSGAGKSTLLRIIAGRVKGAGTVDSKATISFNGRSLASATHRRKLCGFVTQEDNLLPLLTVRETLLFSSWFGGERGAGRKEVEARVQSLMEELGLVHVADSYVGDEETRGVSGGERRRVSIGADLVHDPPILLLDEPTSGLDSTSALHVVSLLASMARKRRQIVVLTIHQPGYRILEFMSSFLLLSSGKVAHSGSLGSLESTITTKMGLKIPAQLNALEFAMENAGKLQEYNRKCRSPGLAERPPSSSSSSSSPRPWSWHRFEHAAKDASNHHRPRPWEVASLSWRFWRVMYRTKQLLLARTAQALVGGVGLGSVYLNVKADERGVRERLGLFAFTLSFLLSSTVEALPIFLQERRVVMREASRSTYRMSSYVIANAVVFVPFLLAVAVVFAVPVYWMVGLNPSPGAFSFFTLVVWLVLLLAGSLVQLLGAVSPDFIFGNSLVCTCLAIFFLFSGYFIPKESIPGYWLPMYYASPYRYPLDALLVNEYWGMRESCFDAAAAGSCKLTGWDVLRSRGLEQDGRWENVAILLAFSFLYRLLAWIVLVWKASNTTY